jgi:hypothetical protein
MGKESRKSRGHADVILRKSPGNTIGEGYTVTLFLSDRQKPKALAKLLATIIQSDGVRTVTAVDNHTVEFTPTEFHDSRIGVKGLVEVVCQAIGVTIVDTIEPEDVTDSVPSPEDLFPPGFAEALQQQLEEVLGPMPRELKSVFGGIFGKGPVPTPGNPLKGLFAPLGNGILDSVLKSLGEKPKDNEHRDSWSQVSD